MLFIATQGHFLQSYAEKHPLSTLGIRYLDFMIGFAVDVFSFFGWRTASEEVRTVHFLASTLFDFAELFVQFPRSVSVPVLLGALSNLRSFRLWTSYNLTQENTYKYVIFMYKYLKPIHLNINHEKIFSEKMKSF